MISQKDMLGIIATEAREDNPAKTSHDVEERSGASFHRGQSKQDYRTPGDFRAAVVKRFGFPDFDLAASFENKFNSDRENQNYFSNDSLSNLWHELRGLLWLNPPFNDIEPWARKCEYEANLGAHILFLTPASVGSCWFQDFVYPNARVIALNPRLCFDGKAPYPKDCILSEFGYSGIKPCFEIWRWK